MLYHGTAIVFLIWVLRKSYEKNFTASAVILTAGDLPVATILFGLPENGRQL